MVHYMVHYRFFCPQKKSFSCVYTLFQCLQINQIRIVTRILNRFLLSLMQLNSHNNVEYFILDSNHKDPQVMKEYRTFPTMI